jgi:hypothetical protein
MRALVTKIKAFDGERVTQELSWDFSILMAVITPAMLTWACDTSILSTSVSLERVDRT